MSDEKGCFVIAVDDVVTVHAPDETVTLHRGGLAHLPIDGSESMLDVASADALLGDPVVAANLRRDTGIAVA